MESLAHARSTWPALRHGDGGVVERVSYFPYLRVQAKGELRNTAGDFVEMNRLCSAISLYNMHTHCGCDVVLMTSVLFNSRNRNEYKKCGFTVKIVICVFHGDS